MDRESYTVPETADYINQHFVAVKVDYDTATQLVAQLQRAQAFLNLPAGLPLTSFLTPDGELYSGAGYLPPARTILAPSLKDAMSEALELYAHPEKLHTNSFQLDLEEIE